MNDVQDKTAFPSRALRAISIREQVEALLRPYLEEFVETIRELDMHQRTYGGAWLLGVRSTDRPGDASDYSRLEFEIAVDPDGDKVDVACKATTFGRDHETQHESVAVDEAGLRKLGDFFETAFLLFASRYYERALRPD